MIDVYTISVIGFFALLAVALYRDRKHVEVKAYIFFLRKTKIGLIFLDKIAKYATFWKIFGTIGIVVAFYLMLSGMYVLVEYGKLILTGVVKQPGLNLVLPSPTAHQVSGTGYIGIPFWTWIIIIASVMIPHELTHGILARVEKIKVKSVGLALFAIFPGAFVEPDERQLKKIGILGRLRIFAGGGFANFLVYLLVIGLVSLMIWPSFVPGGVVITQVNADGPAAAAGIINGTVITEINNSPLTI
ncbi:MAG: site-2 protease family protein, partial [Candidatus Aenigmatarchaeota archaeon]